MPQLKKIEAADLFCGAGGTSSGLALAAKELKRPLRLLAINHWQIAIDTHSDNHPDVEHRCESLDNVDPRKAVPNGRLNLLVASPECTHHSNARGGKPMSDQSRASAWVILRWAEALYIESILIENVREFRSWGPLGSDGRPLKSKKGETYLAFLNSLRSLGYNVEDRILNAADFGDPTTRERLFIIARRGKRVVWPAPTHVRPGAAPLFRPERTWRPAREIIDWTIPSKSIFERKRPLSKNTMARIIAGLQKFGGPQIEPFLVVLRNNCGARSLLGQQSKSSPRSATKPVPTIATHGAVALVEPFVVGAGGPTGAGRPRSTREPLGTVLADDHRALVEPFLVSAGGPKVAARPVSQPANTVLTRDHMALVSTAIVPFHGERKNQPARNHSVDEPMPVVTGNHGLAQAFLVTVNHGEDQDNHARRTHSVHEPLSAVTTKNGKALVQPHIVKYYGTSDCAKSIEEPLDTVTTKDRFGLVLPEVNGYRLDIRFRMLQPHELARAQGFPDSYRFKGNRSEVVRQIGNAVPVNLARALCRAILS